jgi:hypothetical protein
MVKSVSFQNCPVKRSLSMKGKENDFQIDLNNCGRYISSGIKYLYLKLLIHIVRILSFNSTEYVKVKGKTKTEPEIANFFC